MGGSQRQTYQINATRKMYWEEIALVGGDRDPVDACGVALKRHQDYSLSETDIRCWRRQFRDRVAEVQVADEGYGIAGSNDNNVAPLYAL